MTKTPLGWLMLAAAMSLGACKRDETADEKRAREWMAAVNDETNEARIGSQITLCAAPPSNAPASGRLHCSEFIAPAAIKYASVEVQKGKPNDIVEPQCGWLLDGLKLARTDYVDRDQALKLASAKCCSGLIQMERERCRAIGIKYDDSK